MTGGGVKRIHHIDFVVRDLDRAAERYRTLFGFEPEPKETLPERGIELVRFRVGETWLILVQPTRDDSPVAAFLEEHGEGYFHLAFEVDDVETAARDMADRGVALRDSAPRTGLDGWKLVDIEPEETFGALMQLIEAGDV